MDTVFDEICRLVDIDKEGEYFTVEYKDGSEYSPNKEEFIDTFRYLTDDEKVQFL
jgi:hypothetical protein